MAWRLHTGFHSTVSSCKARHFCRLYGEHWNFERCILGGWMRMGLQNWVIRRLCCILGRWYRMLAHMRGVTWQAVPAKFKTGMCEMKKIGSEVCSVFRDVGSGWVGSHVWCSIESCSGKVKKRDVWDEYLGVWGFVVCLWSVGSGWVGTHAWCHLFRVVPAKFKTGMCEMKIFGTEVCSVSWDVGSGWVGSHAWCNMESCSGKVQNRCVRWKS